MVLSTKTKKKNPDGEETNHKS